MDHWTPKSILLLRHYSAAAFAADLVAGVTVGLVALPLAMAFAISSGVSPQAGLYCAVVTGFIISALGGSRFQIGGPTGAFVVVVSGIVATYGIDGLFMCTIMARRDPDCPGGLDGAVTYIPRPLIAASQRHRRADCKTQRGFLQVRWKAFRHILPRIRARRACETASCRTTVWRSSRWCAVVLEPGVGVFPVISWCVSRAPRSSRCCRFRSRRSAAVSAAFRAAGRRS
jgi:hypothetical protein